MRMRKWMAVLLALCLLLVPVSAWSEAELEPEADGAAQEAPVIEAVDEAALVGADDWETDSPVDLSGFDMDLASPDMGDILSNAADTPVATYASVTDDKLVVIAEPQEIAQWMWMTEVEIPVKVKYRTTDSGVTGDALYSPVRVEVLDSAGNLVWATDVEAYDVAAKIASGGSYLIASPKVDVGGTYTIRVKASSSSAWDSVQINVAGPAYPTSEEMASYTLTAGQSEVTIDLAKGGTARLTYSMTTHASPVANYIYYSDFVEDGSATISYQAMSDNAFSYDSKKALWTCDGWIDYAGVRVGSTTLHMYILVNGTRYSHKAVAVNVIDSSKVTTETGTETPEGSVKVDVSACTISVEAQTYTGKALKPAVTVTYGDKVLQQGTDYTVSYANNKAVGTATATVEGKGGYTGTAKVGFVIKPRKATLSKLTAGAKQLTVKWKQQSNITGYQIQYGLKKDLSDGKTVTVKKASTTSRAIKKLKPKKKYYVRIRTYKKVGGKNYYSSWSSVKSAKVK